MNHRKTKRTEQADATRRNILNAALDLFELHGIENVSVAEIAEKARCSPGNIYHYFKSKEDIIRQTLGPIDEDYALFYEKMQTELPYRSMPASELMEEFFCEVIRLCSQSDQLDITYTFALKYPELGSLHVTEERVFYQICIKLLNGMQREGSLTASFSVDDALAILVVQLRGLLVEWMVQNRRFDVISMGRNLIRIVLAGLKCQ